MSEKQNDLSAYATNLGPRKLQNVRIYRANNNNNGFATEWQLAPNTRENNKYQKYNFFLTLAKQTGTDENGNAQFDWKNTVRVLLNEFELGEMIAVLDGRKNSLGFKGNLYHSGTDGANKMIKLDYVEDKGGYNLNVSAMDKDKNKSGGYQMIGQGEAVVLSVMLKRAIEVMIGW